MPYKDREAQREYGRNYMRNRRQDQAYIEKERKYQSEFRRKIRDWIDEVKQQRGCDKCEENTPICLLSGSRRHDDSRCKACPDATVSGSLDFHHKDPTEKLMGISKLAESCASKEKLLLEMSKCDLLCANCHRKQHKKLASG